MVLSYLRRDEWGAMRPTKWNNVTLPISRVYHMATHTRTCSDELSCIRKCQKLQLSHIEKNYGDIRFSFVIGGDGQVYEGRGWKHAPLLPKGYQDGNQVKSILIGYMGMWISDSLPTIMIRASGDLIDYGIANKYLSRDYRSKDLFVNDFKERVFEEILKESRLKRWRKKMLTVNMVKEMGLTNEIADEIDPNCYNNEDNT